MPGKLVLSRYKSNMTAIGVARTVHVAFNAARAQLAACDARFHSRKLEIHQPTLLLLRRAGLRSYHSTAILGAQDTAKSHDTRGGGPSSRRNPVPGPVRLEPYKDALTQQYRAGWSVSQSSAWLELRGIKETHTTVNNVFRSWGIRRIANLEQLEPYKEALLQRREASASTGDLQHWLNLQGFKTSESTIEAVLKQWGAYKPEPKRALLQENLELHKEAMIKKRRAGTSYLHIQTWLREQGVKMSISTIQRHLRSWGAPKPKRHQTSQQDLDSYKESLVRKYYEGSSCLDLQIWLRTQGFKVAELTIRRQLYIWGICEPHKIHMVNLEPYKDTLIAKYRKGYGMIRLAKMLEPLGIKVSYNTIGWRLREWGVLVPHRPWTKNLDAYRDEMIRQYQKGTPIAKIAKWLCEHGQEAGRNVVAIRLQEWGVLVPGRRMQQKPEAHKEDLLRLSREGKSVAEMLEWLEGQDVHVSQGAIERTLRKAGVVDLPNSKGGTR